MQMIQFGHHFLNDSDYLGMAMTEDSAHLTRSKIEDFTARVIIDIRAVGPHDALLGKISAVAENPVDSLRVHQLFPTALILRLHRFGNYRALDLRGAAADSGLHTFAEIALDVVLRHHAVATMDL